MIWLDWRELEKHNDWGVRDKDDATAALWNDGADRWEERSAQELEFADDQVAAMERITADTSVIDVCCGTGPLTIPAAKRAKFVTAFDFNDKMLGYVKKKAEAAGLENIGYLQGNFNTIEPGVDFQPADIAITRHSPAQGNILKFSRFATEYCYSLNLVIDQNDDFPLPGRKGSGNWCRSGTKDINDTSRPDGRKYGYNIHFNLLYEAGADPEIRFVREVKIISAPTIEEIALKLFPVGGSPEIIDYVKRHAVRTEKGYELERCQTMSVMGWNPSKIQWDKL